MRLKFRLIFFFWIFLIANSGVSQVQVTIPDTTIDLGSELLLPVRVSNLSSYDIFSFQFTLSYDSDMLSFQDIQKNGSLTAANGWSIQYNDSIPEKIEIGGYGAYKLTGSGNLLYLVFKVTGDPLSSSNLNFTYFVFNIGNPTANTSAGSVSISNNVIPVTITTNVLNGPTITFDGTSYEAPYTAYLAYNSQHEISVNSTFSVTDVSRYNFESWSDQGSRTHTITATSKKTITASFTKQNYLSVESNYGNPQGSGWYNEGVSAIFSVESDVMSGDDTRYHFSSWTGTGTGSYTGTNREHSVVMNAPITEKASWTPQYYINIVSEHATAYGTGWYKNGENVSFGIDSTSIVRTNERYEFISWTGAGSGSYSGSNAQGTITVSGPVTETATWNAKFYVQTGSFPDGILSVTGNGWYDKNAVFTSMKAPDSTVYNAMIYFFKGWKVNGSVVDGNPMSFQVTEPVSVIADYNPNITVVVTTSVGSGTKVLVDGQEFDAPYTVEWKAGTSHNIGVVDVQAGETGSRYVFDNWNNDGSQIQTVAPTRNVNYIAELTKEYFLTIISEPLDITSFAESKWYLASAMTDLDSIPQSVVYGNNSYRFVQLQIDGRDTTDYPVSILMDKARTVLAKYSQGFFVSGNITFVGAAATSVTMEVSGNESFSLPTNSDGSYVVAGLLAGEYTITPKHKNFRFEPASRTYQISKNEQYQYFAAFYDPQTDVSQEKSEDNLPSEFKLFQNYPNPFTNHTIIEYHLKQNEKVFLTIFNIMGQVVKKYSISTQNAGRYRISWDRNDLKNIAVPSGVYFYRIEAGDFIEMKKMIIL